MSPLLSTIADASARGYGFFGENPIPEIIQVITPASSDVTVSTSESSISNITTQEGDALILVCFAVTAVDASVTLSVSDGVNTWDCIQIANTAGGESQYQELWMYVCVTTNPSPVLTNETITITSPDNYDAVIYPFLFEVANLDNASPLGARIDAGGSLNSGEVAGKIGALCLGIEWSLNGSTAAPNGSFTQGVPTGSWYYPETGGDEIMHIDSLILTSNEEQEYIYPAPSGGNEGYGFITSCCVFNSK